MGHIPKSLTSIPPLLHIAGLRPPAELDGDGESAPPGVEHGFFNHNGEMAPRGICSKRNHQAKYSFEAKAFYSKG